MEIPQHNQPHDLGLTLLGTRAEFGPFAITKLHSFPGFLSTTLHEIAFPALPEISVFSSIYFLRSALRTTQWPTGLLSVLMKTVLTFPRKNICPVQQFHYLHIVPGKRVLKRYP